jgi:hypothetical protein
MSGDLYDAPNQQVVRESPPEPAPAPPEPAPDPPTPPPEPPDEPPEAKAKKKAA